MKPSPISGRSLFAKSVAFALAISSFGIARAQDDYIHAGVKAPALNVPKWLEGKPVDAFKKGQIYAVMVFVSNYKPADQWLVNFAAMADKYKDKAHFIAVGFYDDNPQYINDRVKAVAGKTANCSLGVDDDFSTFNKTWFRPSCLFQTPLVFVIDRNTVIADITGCVGGTDELKGLDSDITNLLAGTFDYEEAKTSQTAQIQVRNHPFETRWKELWPALDLIDRKDYTGAISLMDKAVAQNPSKEDEFTNLRLTAWLKIDEAKAVDCAKGLKKPSVGARQLAETPGLKNETYKWAADTLCSAAQEDPEKGPLLYRVAAQTYFKIGDHKAAIDNQTKYLNFCKDQSAPQRMIDAAQKELDQYQKAATR